MFHIKIYIKGKRYVHMDMHDSVTDLPIYLLLIYLQFIHPQSQILK